MRTRSGRGESSEMAGDGSFLDIVANMVGILILLVLVVGVRAATVTPALHESEDEATLAVVDPSQVDGLLNKVAFVQRDAHRVSNQAIELERAVATRDEERMLVAETEAQMQAEYEQMKAQLSDGDRSNHEQRETLMEAERALEELDLEFLGLAATPTEVETLEHHPTPIATKVEQKPMYVEVRGGSIRYVPVMELLELSSSRRITSTQIGATRIDSDEGLAEYGPIAGYKLRLLKYRVLGKNGQGQQLSRYGRHAEFRPMPDAVGETVAEAKQPNSYLSQALLVKPASKHFVELVISGDSGQAVRELEKHLRAKNYRISKSYKAEDVYLELKLVSRDVEHRAQ